MSLEIIEKNKLDLGCGTSKPVGFYGVDRVDTEDSDLVFDLDEKDRWPLPSNHFDFIRGKDVYEHVERPVHFMEECFRCLRPGGKLYLKSPHRSSQNWTDITHKRLVGFQSMQMFFSSEGRCSYYSDCGFVVEKSRIVFEKRYPWNILLEPVVNCCRWSKVFFENSFLSRLFPAADVVFVLRKPG